MLLIQVAPGQSLQAVIDTLPADDQPVTIHLAPGVYEEKIALRRPRTCIEGESAETTRITWEKVMPNLRHKDLKRYSRKNSLNFLI